MSTAIQLAAAATDYGEHGRKRPNRRELHRHNSRQTEVERHRPRHRRRLASQNTEFRHRLPSATCAKTTSRSQ